jgi:3'-phosphoadenosine 5'-phosphosulfate sulfotransferase (PAPS reductase)/FAD synthetase
MLRQIIDAFGGSLPEDVIPVFANTGLEDARTYAFVAEVSKRWTPIVVVEYGSKTEPHRVVGIEACARNGEPFARLNEDKSYLPNPVARICTAHLKIKAMASYARSLGWKRWSVAIGLRADEPRRVARIRNGEWRESYERVVPIADAGHMLEDVTRFWHEQPFDLQFPSGDNLFGNCVGCFLKSRDRLDRIAREQPTALAWWIAQEKKLGATFRFDRPSYAMIARAVTEQPLLYPEEESLPCDCHS